MITNFLTQANGGKTKVELTDKSIVHIDSPTKMPERQKIKDIREPYIKTNIFVPSEYIGSIMELCQNKRGNYISVVHNLAEWR